MEVKDGCQQTLKTSSSSYLLVTSSSSSSPSSKCNNHLVKVRCLGYSLHENHLLSNSLLGNVVMDNRIVESRLLWIQNMFKQWNVFSVVQDTTMIGCLVASTWIFVDTGRNECKSLCM